MCVSILISNYLQWSRCVLQPHCQLSDFWEYIHEKFCCFLYSSETKSKVFVSFWTDYSKTKWLIGSTFISRRNCQDREHKINVKQLTYLTNSISLFVVKKILKMCSTLLFGVLTTLVKKSATNILSGSSGTFLNSSNTATKSFRAHSHAELSFNIFFTS